MKSIHAITILLILIMSSIYAESKTAPERIMDDTKNKENKKFINGGLREKKDIPLSEQNVNSDIKKGLMHKYYKAEGYYENLTASTRFKTKVLSQNLTSAVKDSLMRLYLDNDKRMENLDISKIQFENEKGTYNYYLKYQDHLFIYVYALDPEMHLQNPVHEKVYTIPNKK